MLGGDFPWACNWTLSIWIIAQAILSRSFQTNETVYPFFLFSSGMSLPSCNPKLGYGISQIFSNYYPERLGMIICLHHNPIFHGVWNAIKSLPPAKHSRQDAHDPVQEKGQGDVLQTVQRRTERLDARGDEIEQGETPVDVTAEFLGGARMTQGGTILGDVLPTFPVTSNR